MRTRDLWHRFQVGTGRLRDRLADDWRFWSLAVLDSKATPITVFVLGVVAVFWASALVSESMATTIGAVTALRWGNLVNPTSGLMLAILVIGSYGTRARPSWAAVAAIVWYFVSFVNANLWRLADERDLAVQLYQLGAFDVLFIYCWQCWYFVRRPDILRQGDVPAQLYWTVLMVAEFGQIIEYLGCKILYDPYTDDQLATIWRIAVEASACGRAFEFWSRHLFTVITSIILAWIVLRAYQTWKRTKRSGRS